jgi:hypothetical protein
MGSIYGFCLASRQGTHSVIKLRVLLDVFLVEIFKQLSIMGSPERVLWRRQWLMIPKLLNLN